MTTTSSNRSPSRRWPIGLAAAAVVLLISSGLAAAVAPASSTSADPTPVASAGTPPAPAFFAAATQRAAGVVAPRSVPGTHRLVTLRAAVLPERASGQRIGFDLGGATPVTGRFTAVDHTRHYTAWTGVLEHQSLGSFTIVRVGSVYRAEVVSPAGAYAVTRAAGDQYWLTAVAPYHGPSGDDTVASSRVTGPRESARLRWTVAQRGRAKARIDVLFGYTQSAKIAAGNKANLKADAALAIADTNLTLKNSGIKVSVRYRGLVRTAGHESHDVLKDLNRIGRPHDGHFDNLLPARTRHHADIVHLFTGGPSDQLCGAGFEPLSPRYARPVNGASTSYVSCLPYLVTTHELGHNMGGDHIKYPGVTHYSRLPYAYGFYNVPGGYLSVMGYYDPCQDVGKYDCVRLPYFSSPTATVNGQPLGVPGADNTRAVKKIAPLVARYAR